MSELLRAALKAALSGGLTGGAVGGGTRFLLGHEAGGIARAATKAEIAKAALKAGAVGASIGAGSQAVGNSILGTPDENDQGTPYTKRGALGGGLVGGLTGGVLGGMMAGGKLGGISKPLGRIGERVAESVPDNIALQYLRKLGANPTREGMIAGAGLGAAVVGLPSAYEGADEGAMMDEVRAQMQEKEREQMKQKLMERELALSGY